MTDVFVFLLQLAHVPHAIMAILEAESRMDEDLMEEVMDGHLFYMNTLCTMKVLVSHTWLLLCLNQTAEASGQDLIAKRLAQEKSLKRQILEDQKGRRKQEPEEEAEMDLPIILVEEEEEIVVSLSFLMSSIPITSSFLILFSIHRNMRKNLLQRNLSPWPPHTPHPSMSPWKKVYNRKRTES